MCVIMCVQLVGLFICKITEKENREDYCTISLRLTGLSHISTIQERGKMSYYHIFCALLAEQNCQHI